MYSLAALSDSDVLECARHVMDNGRACDNPHMTAHVHGAWRHIRLLTVFADLDGWLVLVDDETGHHKAWGPSHPEYSSLYSQFQQVTA